MKRFYLHRNIDVSGVSGVGRVAQGVIFDDGTCVIRWISQWTSTAVYNNHESMMNVHGHNGATQCEFIDEE